MLSENVESNVESLEAMFHPKSVAIIGASNTPGKIGHTVLRNMQESYSGLVFPINPKADSIFNHKTYPSVLDIPKENEIDLAIICIPSRFCIPVIEECGKRGVKGLVIISAGFKEIGGEGRTRELEIVELAKRYKMRVLGPNCLGLITNGNFSFASITPKKGHIAMLSQSGAMMTGLLDWAVEQDIGFSSFISLGNKCDADEVDYIEYLAQDENTKVIAGYIESVQDGEKFFRVVSAAAKKKPVILLKSGRSVAGAKAASSHTGALAGSDIAFDLAFKKTGVIRADTISDLFNYALTFLQAPIPKGDTFAIITNAGGPGIVCTDAMEKEGVPIARFSAETVNKLKEKLPAESNFYNPVDIIGDAPPERYHDAIDILFNTPDTEVAGGIVLLTPQAQTNPMGVAQLCGQLHAKYPSKVMIGAFIGGVSVSDPAAELMKNGVPVYPFPEDAVRVIRGLIEHGQNQARPLITEKEINQIKVNSQRVREIIEQARADHRVVLLSHETAEIFEHYGIRSPKSRLAQTARDAATMAEDLGFPVVMKIVSPEIIHKWDLGGVILNITTPQEAKEAFMTIMTNAKTKGPSGANIYGVEVQEMIVTSNKKKSTELILGINRDPTWGPMLMVGSGGIYANYVKDVAFDLAFHFDQDDASHLLQKTRIFQILKGVRGESSSDIEGIIQILIRLSQLVNDFEDILELDINPCLIFEDTAGYSAVDIKITIKK